METGAAVLVAGLATILVIHALQGGTEQAGRYARFVFTGRGPNGERLGASTTTASTTTAAPAPRPARSTTRVRPLPIAGQIRA